MDINNKLTSFNIEYNTIRILRYLQNDDKCWGEFKTQSSRITNTCEVIWSVSFFQKKNYFDIEKTIECIEKSVFPNKNSNVLEYFLECEVARDFGWVLIALTSLNKLENKVVNRALRNIEKQQTSNGGFCARGETKESLFNSAIVGIGLVNLLKTSKQSRTKNRARQILNKLGLYLITNYNKKKNDGEFSYVFYLMSLMKKKGLLLNDEELWEKLEEEALSIDINLDSREEKSRDYKKGVYRPYRHYSSAWLLLAFTELDSKLRHQYAKKLLKNFSLKDGWRPTFVDYGLTWANAIAYVAMKKYIDSVDPIPFLTQDSNNLKLEERIDMNQGDLKKVFIVHGHDETALLQLKNLLRSDLNLIPIIARDEPTNNLESTLQKIRRLVSECHTSIILLTLDDLVSKNGIEYMQARPNVILEIGICIEKCQGGVILLRKGGSKLFSDIDGLVYVPYERNIKEVYLDLEKQLKNFKAIS